MLSEAFRIPAFPLPSPHFYRSNSVRRIVTDGAFSMVIEQQRSNSWYLRGTETES